jgi:hypothetical protein
MPSPPDFSLSKDQWALVQWPYGRAKDAKGPKGETLLLRLLDDLSWNMDGKDWTPLSKEMLSIVRTLLSEGADPNATDLFGHHPLKAAAKLGNTTLIRWLLEAGANPNEAHHLFNRGRTHGMDCLKTYVKHWAKKPKKTQSILTQSPTPATAATWARPRQARALDLALLLVEFGADPSVQDDKGRTMNDYLTPRVDLAEEASRRLAGRLDQTLPECRSSAAGPRRPGRL